MKQFKDEDNVLYSLDDILLSELPDDDKKDIKNLKKGEMILINTTWIKRIK